MGSYPNRTNMVFPRITRTGSGSIVLTNHVGMPEIRVGNRAEGSSVDLEPSASAFPDDDTVSIRTYTSTPPPFPDDGRCLYCIRFSKVFFLLIFPLTSLDAGLPTYEEATDFDPENVTESFATLGT